MAYSPLGRGFFGGKATVESLPTESVLVNQMHTSQNDFLHLRFERCLSLIEIDVVCHRICIQDTRGII